MDLIDYQGYRSFRFLLYRLFRKLFKIEVDFLRVNRKLLNATRKLQYDIIWVDKGLVISDSTLKRLRSASINPRLVHFSRDDMLNPGNQSKCYLRSIPHYDIHATTKSYHQHELTEMGAKKVVYVRNSFDPKIHKPVKLDNKELKEYGSQVGFIGAYEEDREQHINQLCQLGFHTVVRSRKWPVKGIPNLTIYQGWFADSEYCKIINATKINLGFLRKINRDLQTGRSVEIPACGGFLLAERTEEHQQLFKEGEEAEYFESFQELKDKVAYYLVNDSAREKIAKAARKRCLTSGYDNATTLLSIIEELMKDSENSTFPKKATGW